VLRKAVNDNLSVPRAGEAPEEAAGGARKRPFKPSSSKRQQLTAEEAAEIYKLRPQPGKGGTLRRGSMLHCKAVAPKYGVTPKTIRDVWSGRSWAEATKPLWTEEEIKRRSANEEDSKHSLERSGMPPHAMHPDDPSRMAVSYPYMPGMGSCGMVGGHMINWGGGAGPNGAFQPPGYMPSVALANMAGLGILSAGHMTGMPGGFNFMGPGGAPMDANSMQGAPPQMPAGAAPNMGPAGMPGMAPNGNGSAPMNAQAMGPGGNMGQGNMAGSALPPNGKASDSGEEFRGDQQGLQQIPPSTAPPPGWGEEVKPPRTGP